MTHSAILIFFCSLTNNTRPDAHSEGVPAAGHAACELNVHCATTGRLWCQRGTIWARGSDSACHIDVHRNRLCLCVTAPRFWFWQKRSCTPTAANCLAHTHTHTHTHSNHFFLRRRIKSWKSRGRDGKTDSCRWVRERTLPNIGNVKYSVRLRKDTSGRIYAKKRKKKNEKNSTVAMTRRHETMTQFHRRGHIHASMTRNRSEDSGSLGMNTPYVLSAQWSRFQPWE